MFDSDAPLSRVATPINKPDVFHCDVAIEMRDFTSKAIDAMEEAHWDEALSYIHQAITAGAFVHSFLRSLDALPDPQHALCAEDIDELVEWTNEPIATHTRTSKISPE